MNGQPKSSVASFAPFDGRGEGAKPAGTSQAEARRIASRRSRAVSSRAPETLFHRRSADPYSSPPKARACLAMETDFRSVLKRTAEKHTGRRAHGATSTSRERTTTAARASSSSTVPRARVSASNPNVRTHDLPLLLRARSLLSLALAAKSPVRRGETLRGSARYVVKSRARRQVARFRFRIRRANAPRAPLFELAASRRPSRREWVLVPGRPFPLFPSRPTGPVLKMDSTNLPDFAHRRFPVTLGKYLPFSDELRTRTAPRKDPTR